MRSRGRRSPWQGMAMGMRAKAGVWREMLSGFCLDSGFRVLGSSTGLGLGSLRYPMVVILLRSGIWFETGQNGPAI